MGEARATALSVAGSCKAIAPQTCLEFIEDSHSALRDPLGKHRLCSTRRLRRHFWFSGLASQATLSCLCAFVVRVTSTPHETGKKESCLCDAGALRTVQSLHAAVLHCICGVCSQHA